MSTNETAVALRELSGIVLPTHDEGQREQMFRANEADVDNVINMVNDQDPNLAYGQPRILATIKDDRIRYSLPGSDEPILKEEESTVIIAAGVITRKLSMGKKDENITVCVSRDAGVHGEVNIMALDKYPELPISTGQECETCPFNAWGSAIGDEGEARRGKRCSERRNLLMIHPEFVVPVILSVSPSSIGAWDTYAKSFVVKRPVSSYIAWHTKVGAKVVKRDGNEWGVLEFSKAEPSTPQEVVGAASLRIAYMPQLVIPFEGTDEE